MELLVIGLLMLAVYVASVCLHPYMACEACEGRGRHQGSWFNKSFRPCHVCSGTGRKQRLGARVLGRGQPRRPGRRMP
jgi:DnaJ-class molecular chaperone